MKKIAYYHTYLDDLCTWANIFVEQMKYMEQSNLLQNLEKIKITAITQSDSRVRFFNDLCKTYPVESEIEYIQNPHKNDQDMMGAWSIITNTSERRDNSISENYTLKKIWNDCKTQDNYVLYFHAKGITATLNNLIIPGRITKYKNRYNWRQFLNWGVMTKWEECVASLEDGCDTASVDFKDVPLPHYSGNFWWSKSEHIRNLPDPQETIWWEEIKRNINDPWIKNSSDRFRDEMWVCVKENTKTYNVKDNTGEYVANDI
jgi:hypothetical protein